MIFAAYCIVIYVEYFCTEWFCELCPVSFDTTHDWVTGIHSHYNTSTGNHIHDTKPVQTLIKILKWKCHRNLCRRQKKFNYFKVDLFFWDAHCSYLSLNWVHVINLSECHGTHSITFMALCMYIFYPLPVKREILVRISFIWCIGLFFISSIPNFEKI